MTEKEIATVLAPWTSEHQAAAQHEGWELTVWSNASHVPVTVQVQYIDDPERLPPSGCLLPSDTVAMAIVRTGTGAHHSVARQIIHDHFPDEWALMEQATASFTGLPKETK